MNKQENKLIWESYDNHSKVESMARSVYEDLKSKLNINPQNKKDVLLVLDKVIKLIQYDGNMRPPDRTVKQQQGDDSVGITGWSGGKPYRSSGWSGA